MTLPSRPIFTTHPMRTLIISLLFATFSLSVTAQEDPNCPYNANVATFDLDNGHPQLLTWGMKYPEYPITANKVLRRKMSRAMSQKFEAKYNVKLVTLEVAGIKPECIKAYNEIMFAHLDKTHGTAWRKEARPDVAFLQPRK